MTYSKKPKYRYGRIWACVLAMFFVGGLIGFGVGKSIPQTQNTNKDVLEPQESIPPIVLDEPDVPKYGTRDGRTFLNGLEMSLDWGGDGDFIPLDCPLDVDTQEFIYYLSMGYYIDYSFVLGLIEHESTFRPSVISATNDYGLMQINKQNHAWLSEKLGVTNFLDPTQNIRAGLYILRGLFEKYDDPAKVLMAYNLGEGGAKALWNKGIYQTSYTNSVLAYAEKWQTKIDEMENDHD